jgi:hypothetical protein
VTLIVGSLLHDRFEVGQSVSREFVQDIQGRRPKGLLSGVKLPSFPLHMAAGFDPERKSVS